ncbi:FAD-dependent oxygenase [Aspergillus arachidicola]|uniref:FAD-dependent oxygenase n=1 Tax=Aspergillus arachidicola TaxID=656916 RepID=A0A2G7FRK9_9EURO|nr:FAD-dependent oxygenase [Aspergillus arachidicola]
MVMKSLKFWASSLLYATLLRECHAQQSDANIGSELGGKLSSDASIYFPGNDLFNNATARWSQYGKPNISVVVEVANKWDVAETVKYATKHDVPFIAINGGHGNIESLENVHQGIEIWMHKLNTVEISDDTATFGGGILSHQVIESLWAAGKQTVTGVCDCTGFLGPALGGGHGYLQGRHGLIADNFVSLEVVTADGKIRTVTRDGPESDLFWAMQGAGHNFGIVTSVTQKIYDVPNNGVWSFVKHTYTQDKLELLFQYLNILGWNGQRVDVMYWATISRDAEIDPVNPIIDIFVLQEGVETMDATVSTSLLNFAPVKTVTHSGPYVDITKWTEFNIGSRACDKGDEGPQIVRFPINLKTYNLEALRRAFNAFAEETVAHPDFEHSTIMLEGYSNQGVQAVDPVSTAYAHRDDTILVSSVIIFEQETDRPAAEAFGDRVRDILHEGSGEPEKHVYVNYASGDEPLESMYGYEPWRQSKLSALKRKYDPENRFGFYAPIPAADW